MSIKPSLLEFNNLEIKRALSVLRYGLPDAYKKVCANVTVIEPDLPCGGAGGGCFEPWSPKKIIVSTQHNGSIAFTAGIIFHETCHVLQKKENRAFDEQECYRTADDYALKNLVQN